MHLESFCIFFWYADHSLNNGCFCCSFIVVFHVQIILSTTSYAQYLWSYKHQMRLAFWETLRWEKFSWIREILNPEKETIVRSIEVINKLYQLSKILQQRQRINKDFTHWAVISPVILNLFSGDEKSRFLNGSKAPLATILVPKRFQSERI